MDRKYDLICFDLDGTLIVDTNGDILWERILKKIYGHNDLNKERYELYKAEEIDFAKWVDLDLSDWKNGGMTRDILIEEMKSARLNQGAKELITKLKEKGYKLAVISGSVDILLETIFPDHPFIDVFINKINFDDKGNIIDWYTTPYGDKGKETALKIIAEKHNIDLSKTVYIGDHLNDISVSKIAGLSISYNSKTKELNNVCNHNLEGDMMQILDLIEGDKQ